ncbi:MAG: DUF1194 domain-containing protein [Hyphomicrobiales bacterium]|nr:DUF1194 domain-containing protein [Hyphomicrobiales bacterium]MCP5371136.1 DUF1194 domain-containing protein [Hyphomicrobiales bacterium]
MIRRILTSLVLVLLAPAAWAAEKVDLELVLLADASRSIDAAESRFQRQGYATAITHEDILFAIAHGRFKRIAVTYVEWGDDTSQDVVVPWTVIDGPDSAAAFANALMAAPRRANGPNAIGAALTVAQGLIDTNAYDGARRVIDLSGDSAFSMDYIEPARQAAVGAGTTINGLAILCRQADCGGRPVGYDLEAAFAAEIIGGRGAFVVTADGRDRFAAAVRRKLILEIAGPGLPGAEQLADRHR